MLAAIRDYFSSAFGWQHTISIGKIDNNSKRAICFYTSNTARAAMHPFGGKVLQSHQHKDVTILLRFGLNKTEAEAAAQEIFDFFDEVQFELNGKHAFALSAYEGPIDLGTDANGVYEYSLEFDFYVKKE